MSPPTLYEVTESIPAIGATPGDYVMLDGALLCLLRELPAATLTPKDRASLRPTVRRPYPRRRSA
jgi:hypothetical protein